jgi:hypothetical protein
MAVKPPPKLQLSALKPPVNGSPSGRRGKLDDADGSAAGGDASNAGELVSITIVPDEQGR